MDKRIELLDANIEERIIRWDSLALPCGASTDRESPFGLVREACTSLARVLPPEPRPTLVLLKADDLSGGVLEAVLGFPRLNCTDSNKLLVEKILELVDSKHIMLAVCMSQPSLEAWERDEWLDSECIKEHEFFIRLMENYRLGIIIGGINDGKDFIEARIHRALEAAVRRSRERKNSRKAQQTDNILKWKRRRSELRGDVEKIFGRAESVMGKDLKVVHFGATRPDSSTRFLQIVARIDQFGKRPVKNIRKGIEKYGATRDALEPYSDGSYGLRRNLKRAVRHSDSGRPELFGYLQAYDFFRDSARWLGDGVFPWARERQRPRRRSTDQRASSVQGDSISRAGTKRAKADFRVLFIDETLGPSVEPSDGETAPAHDPAETKHLRTRLSEVFSLLFGDRPVELHAILSTDGALPSAAELKDIGDSIAEIDRFFEHILPYRTQRVENWKLQPSDGPSYPQWTFCNLDASDKRCLRDYDAIFCEIDYRTRFAGPQVVQKLASYLERTASGDRRSTLPALIVLTHMDNIGHVQQCLNLGAHSFVNKERIYQIPSRLKRAIEDVRAGENADDAASTGGIATRRERFGQHANFRMLYSLRPDRTAHLRNSNPKQLFVGGWMRGENSKTPLPVEPGEERFFGRGTRRNLPVWDGQDREWIKRLPKADLHCHFGTSIRLETIEALAFNTCGHLFRNWTGAAYEIDLLPAQISIVLDQICEIVVRAVSARRSPERAQSPAIDYFRAMEDTLGHARAGQIPTDPYGAIVKALMKKPPPPIRDHFIVALLVAVTARLREGRGSSADQIKGTWAYFGELADWCERYRRGSPPRWFNDFVAPAVRLGAAAAEALRKSVGPLPENHMARQKIWAEIQKPSVVPKKCQKFWSVWHANISKRLDATTKVIDKLIEKAVANLSKEKPDIASLFTEGPCRSAPTLAELVVLPEKPATDEHSLLRYLWGCGLLGAEHLQYPENIILAAHDLVVQNVDDNVVYTEVRCETPGYTRAGLSAEMVTDLLCASFDLATTFEVAEKKGTFVRTNVLLAAKRHKSGPEIETVITLLASYLRRRSAAAPVLDKSDAPAWWQPARVVGFDLSGDESKSSSDLTHHITRLIELSSPITIHAGEAASAESIWQAVYEYHARRIGHGLRLRERGHLLQFCINEGICMEMCPISNCFTSDFVQINWDDKEDPFGYDRHKIEHYPLRHFMEAGLEVCINTDNRSLHGDYYGRTLTDEFLWAARLSGGFTRWEVLKLVKAGFKHAFIDKSDAQELLQAVENWMFAQVANAPGLDWHPPRRVAPTTVDVRP